MLHSKYRHLEKTNSYDKLACKSFIRQMMKKVIEREKSISTSSSLSSNKHIMESCSKKSKNFDEEYETGNANDEYDVGDNELERYLGKRLDTTNLPHNSLNFWKNHKMKFPILAKIARQMSSIPATCTYAERSFSAGGNIRTKHRTNIKPVQLNNIIFLQSFYSLY